jgi:hypothetical protein
MRHWFRFSLRALFMLVTVFACWLGYEMNWIRQRRAVINDPGVQNWRYFIAVSFSRNPPRQERWKVYSVAPWPLNWLGEPGYWAVGLAPGTSDGELARVQRLFPEAEGVVVDENRLAREAAAQNAPAAR